MFIIIIRSKITNRCVQTYESMISNAAWAMRDAHELYDGIFPQSDYTYSLRTTVL